MRFFDLLRLSRNLQPINCCLWLILFGVVWLHTPSARAQDADPRNMTRTEVQWIQEALTWASNYYGLKDGTWGRIAGDAAAEWRRENGLAASDSFSASQLRLLFAQGSRERAGVGWTAYRDPNTGVWIGYPGMLVQPQLPDAVSRGVAVTTLRGGDETLNIALFGPGLDLRQLREMLTSLGQEPQVEEEVYRLDRANRQVRSMNLRSGFVRYIRFDREGSIWRGFAINIAMVRQDVGRLISAISGEFSASGRSVVQDPTNLPFLGPILENVPMIARPMPEAAAPTVDVPPPRR